LFGWISDKIEKVVDYSREHSDTIKKYLPIMATVGALIGTKMGRGLLKHGGRATWRLGKFGAGALWKTGKSVASTIRGNDIAGLVRNIPAMLKSFVSILGSTKIGSMVGGIMGKMAQTGVGQAFTNVIAKVIPSVVVRAFSGPVGWGLLIAQGAKMIWDYVLPQSWKDEIKYQVAKAYIATIDGIKSGTIRLRDKHATDTNTCTTSNNKTDSNSAVRQSDNRISSGRELSRQTSEDLIRLATGAEQTNIALKSCIQQYNNIKEKLNEQGSN
jgi:hypothetical protein